MKELLNELKYCANKLDEMGYTKEADIITNVMIKTAQNIQPYEDSIEDMINASQQNTLEEAEEEVDRVLNDPNVSDEDQEWLEQVYNEVGAIEAIEQWLERIGDRAGDLGVSPNDRVRSDFERQEVRSMPVSEF